ncbi:response regulator [Chryseoglobus sp. 28M-23]|uniref:response regulator n=1 Tax=Chryseoglobus sp. 28M-23 TaxID=2772253 RepID=UPI0017476838|nr:response regulator [Chryseoglobus sp. 28M-23]QOD93013.1 response regulator transcription factor [Chryseoglobus sp. 28M-23]
MNESGVRALRVVVADDDPFTLSLVTGGLEAQGFDVTSATSAEEALNAVARVDPHALVSDLNFGTGRTGAALLDRVADDFPWIGLVVLTSHRSPELAVPDPELIPAGVVYLVKSQLSRVDELADAVHRAISGQIDADVVRDDDDVPTVTAAQAEVLRMLAEGASTRALAEHRGTTVRAVETMLNRLFLALGLDTGENASPRVAAVTLWQRGGIRVRRAGD